MKIYLIGLLVVALSSQVAVVAQRIDYVEAYTFIGDERGDTFGAAVSGAGDVNNDGFADLMVATDYTGAGLVRVFSGVDGSILFDATGGLLTRRFGFSLGDAGDVNGDGFDDLLVGTLVDRDDGIVVQDAEGSVRVLSGSDGATLFKVFGDANNDANNMDDNFGVSVSNAGDVNNDGVSDIVVGAFRDDNGGPDSGSARVFSGVDGSALFTLNGSGFRALFGGAVSGAGDVNNDGFADLVIGATGARDSGSAFVYSGADGSLLFDFSEGRPNAKFGNSVSEAGDVNNDGFADLIVGARSNGLPLDSGSAYVFSGEDGAVLHTFNGDSSNDRLGDAVSGIGDINNDGFSDLLVSAPGDSPNGRDSGSVFIFSGRDGSQLFRFSGEEGDSFGQSVSDAGDVNGDGVTDFIVGASSGAAFHGYARVFVSVVTVPETSSFSLPILVLGGTVVFRRRVGRGNARR